MLRLRSSPNGASIARRRRASGRRRIQPGASRGSLRFEGRTGRPARRACARAAGRCDGGRHRAVRCHGNAASALDFLRFMVGAYLDLFVEPTPDDVVLVAVGCRDPGRGVGGRSGRGRPACGRRVGGCHRTGPGRRVDPCRRRPQRGRRRPARTHAWRGRALAHRPRTGRPAVVRRTCDDWIATALVAPDIA